MERDIFYENFSETIDEDNTFEENYDDVDDTIETDTVTFESWMEEKKTIDEAQLEDVELNEVFSRAETNAAHLNQTFATMTWASLESAGSAISGLLSVISSCGPLCSHVIGSLAQSAGSLGVPGLQLGAMQGQGFEDLLNSVSNVTGLSADELLSGYYSTEDILMRLLYGLGDGLYDCCFGFIHIFFDAFIPTKSTYLKQAA